MFVTSCTVRTLVAYHMPEPKKKATWNGTARHRMRLGRVSCGAGLAHTMRMSEFENKIENKCKNYTTKQLQGTRNTTAKFTTKGWKNKSKGREQKSMNRMEEQKQGNENKKNIKSTPVTAHDEHTNRLCCYFIRLCVGWA